MSRRCSRGCCSCRSFAIDLRPPPRRSGAELAADRATSCVADSGDEPCVGRRRTHPERINAPLQEKGAEWRRYERTHGGTEAAREMLWERVTLDRARRFDTEDIIRFPPSEERIMTRLGGAKGDVAGEAGGYPIAGSRTRLARRSRELGGDAGGSAAIVNDLRPFRPAGANARKP